MIFLLFCAAVMPGRVQAQDTEFWFVAPDFMNVINVALWQQPVYFMITAGDDAANVTVSMPAFLGDVPLRTVHVNANSSQMIVFGEGTSQFAYSQLDTLENTVTKAGITGIKYDREIHITSDYPVFVYYAVSTTGSKTLFALKGKNALGKSFYIPAEQNFNIGTSYTQAFKQFHVVASEDNTEITVTPVTDWFGGPSGTRQTANVPYTTTLDKGQTVAVRAFENNPALPRLIGSTVTALKPVAVTVAEDEIDIPGNNDYPGGGDAGGDQIVPSSNVGRQYVVIRSFTGPSQGDFVYIMATQPNTSVTVTPQGGTPLAPQTIAAAGGYIKYHLSTQEAAFISASHPVYVWQQSGINGEADCVLVPSMYSHDLRIENKILHYY
jgi:hypothetical protein